MNNKQSEETDWPPISADIFEIYDGEDAQRQALREMQQEGFVRMASRVPNIPSGYFKPATRKEIWNQ